MSTATKIKPEVQEARDQLCKLLPPGSTVRTILRHVSRSGMMRAISPVINGEDYSWLVVRAAPDYFRFNQRHGGITMNGCGMDMGFELVYTLGRILYPSGHECAGENCRSNDHSNGDRDYTPHQHSDGGYALRQDWL